MCFLQKRSSAFAAQIKIEKSPTAFLRNHGFFNLHLAHARNAASICRGRSLQTGQTCSCHLLHTAVLHTAADPDRATRLFFAASQKYIQRKNSIKLPRLEKELRLRKPRCIIRVKPEDNPRPHSQAQQIRLPDRNRVRPDGMDAAKTA